MDREIRSENRLRWRNCAISLLINSDRSVPRPGNEIVEEAKKFDFSEEDSEELIEETYRYRIIPRKPRDRTAGISKLILDGDTVARVAITSSAEAGAKVLKSGNYYLHVDFIEGGDLNEAHWFARLIDERGDLAKILRGVEVHQVIQRDSISRDDAIDQSGIVQIHTHLPPAIIDEVFNLPHPQKWIRILHEKKSGDGTTEIIWLCLPGFE
ncbi:MAG: hypothetical protein OEN23_18855 [Paracoccaceae bacterium]|nr:hypothetical protein [Paracoccaceae bacterium]